MGTGFHRFSELPYELREQIWSLAVRDLDEPGAHFFGLKAYSKGKALPGCSLATFTTPGCDVRRRMLDCDLTTPSTAWGQANLSAYLIDGGLQFACSESRRIMHSIIQRNHSPKTPAENDFSACYKLENQPVVSVRFQDAQHASPCEFTLHPTLDLFVFSLEHFRAIGVHGYDVYVRDEFIGPRDFRNIGLEFDPDWVDIYRRYPTLTAEDEKILEYFAEAGVYELEESTIYLIDYSIQCNETILRWERETGKDATAFIARDGRFVCLSYPGQYDIGTGDGDRDIYRGSSFSFAETLREEIESMVAARYGSEWEDEAPYHERTASIEVLAWIPSTADPRCQKVIELF